MFVTYCLSPWLDHDRRVNASATALSCFRRPMSGARRSRALFGLLMMISIVALGWYRSSHQLASMATGRVASSNLGLAFTRLRQTEVGPLKNKQLVWGSTEPFPRVRAQLACASYHATVLILP